MRSILKTITERCDANMQKILDYAAGLRENTFASEEAFIDEGCNVIKEKSWFQKVIDEFDEICFKDDDSLTQNIAEFIDSYTQQRDMNYVYSERLALFQKGYDTNLGDEYRAGLVQGTYKEVGAREEKTSISG